MNKLITLLSAVFLAVALSGVNAWADEPVTDVLDRHSSWSGFIEQRSQTASGDAQSTSASIEDKSEMKVKPEDLPWKRVG